MNVFSKLDQDLQHIITCLAESQTNLATLVTHESAKTRQDLIAQFDRSESHRLYQEIKESLFYPDITSREDQIVENFDGIENSYDWVFDESQKKQPWSDFSEWLRSGKAVYWINGKAGSGKSTLMKYICDHSRKNELLKQWSASRRLLTATFFFWNAGTSLQKTIIGLLRSIIYQILTKCRELINYLKNEPLHAWSEKRLLTVLTTLLTQSKIPLNICIFIDGLDEFEGRYDAVVEAIGSLIKQAHVKIYLSSRPLLKFEKAFENEPQLRLQDMTFDSIHAYAHDRLLDPIQKRFTNSKNNLAKAKDLLDSIVWRSDGVFLWVVLAVRDVRDGLQDFVDLDELVRAIEQLPADVDGLYMKMLNGIKPAYRRDAARFIQIVLYLNFYYEISLDLYTLYYFIETQKRVLEDLSFDYEIVDERDVVQACHDLRNQLRSHTGGLLDLTSTDRIDDRYFEQDDHEPILFNCVQVHHRTVRDFFLKNTAAKAFLTDVGMLEQHARLSIARGTVAHLVHLSQRDGELLKHYGVLGSVALPLLSVMSQVSMIERLVGVAQGKFIRSLHRYSFVPHHRISAATTFKSESVSIPFVIGPPPGCYDLIAMAAARGMGRYVCEVLDLAFVEPVGFSGLEVVKAKAKNEAFIELVPSTHHQLNPISYRERLNECLTWKTDDQISMERNATAETYVLACLNPDTFDSISALLTFIQILLQAGANPMARFENFSLFEEESSCFWFNWLSVLRFNACDLSDLSWEYSRANLNDVWKTTKACIAQGANINYQTEDNLYLKSGPFDIEFECSAMFDLEKLFYSITDFQEFAAAVEPTVMRPLRKIASIKERPYLSKTRVYPTNEELKMLRPLVEKWEKTSYPDDSQTLQSALRRVWIAHRPDDKFSGESKEDTDEESENSNERETGEVWFETDEEIIETTHEE